MIQTKTERILPMSEFIDQWKKRLDQIVNHTDSPEGRAFDIILIICIVLSSILIILESVENINRQFGFYLVLFQYVFLAIFTLEYLLRIVIVDNKRGYVLSFFGIIDLLAILPFYLGFFMPLGRLFPLVRTLRLLRLFSIFKMGRYVRESGALLRALKASRAKIIVFLWTVFFIVIIAGAVMYRVEGTANGFTSIPQGMYWAVVTLSTVGYGDILPQTVAGKMISSFLMIVGYGVIAVPTGIITSEMTSARALPKTNDSFCPSCGQENHFSQASYCHQCGDKLTLD